jgi:hypothetical protein
LRKRQRSKKRRLKTKKDFEKVITYNFLCKCDEAEFSTFSEFLDHVKHSHGVKNLNFSEIFAKNHRNK